MNDELREAIRPVKARLKRNRFVCGAAWGLAAGFAAALLMRIVTLFVPLADKWLWPALTVPAFTALFAAGNALRPVNGRTAAEAADRCGLKERAVTALENSGDDSEISLLQRRDACRALREMDPKLIRPKGWKRPLAAALCCCVALTGLLMIRTQPDRTAEKEKALKKTIEDGIREIDLAAQADEENLTEEKKRELRKLTGDLKKDLADSRDEADALAALDRAEQRLEKMQGKTAGEAAAESSAGSANEAREGSDGGDGQNAGQPGSSTPSGEGRAAEKTDGTGKNAAKTSAAVKALKTAVNPSLKNQNGRAASTAQGNGNQTGENQNGGQNGPAAGNSNNGHQNGNGAGTGSTNLEQNGGGKSPGGHAAGDRAPEMKQEKYETIYDPERAEKARRDEMTNQNRLGDEEAEQAETGPGKGKAGGNVPWGSVFREYAETEARSAERGNLTAEERQWVDEYYRILTGQQGKDEEP